MKSLAVIVVLLVAGAGIYWSATQDSSSTPTSERRGPPGGFGKKRTVPITVADVINRPFADQVEAIGTARATESVIITAKVTDKISSINFADGARVEKGALLVELTNDEQAAQLAEAKADRDEARAQLKRLEELVPKNTVAASQVDESRARFSIANARLEGIVARLKDRVIRAPFAGVLGFREISPGTLVTPGTRITTLDDVSTLKLDFAVPELFLGAIDIGDAVTASSPAYRKEQFSGTVTGIDSRVDEITRSVTIRALLPNDRGALRPGMLLTVELKTAERTALAVPEASVIPVDREAYVFVIGTDNVAERRTVTTGQRSDGMIEILSGLEAGERVAVLGLVSLRNGVPVVINEPAGA
ncbi:MAG: efflux RND transporter periplasmic adaptor subunit [Gammaproteobacteria bacterium]